MVVASTTMFQFLHLVHWLFQSQRAQLGSLVVQGVGTDPAATHCGGGCTNAQRLRVGQLPMLLDCWYCCRQASYHCQAAC